MAETQAAAAAAGPEVDSLESPAAAAGFEEAIAPIEALAGDQLFGEGRAVCRRAFEESPEGFCIVVERLMRRSGLRNPLAVLITASRERDHLRAHRPRARRWGMNGDGADTSPTPLGWRALAHEDCVDCREERPIDYAGRCERCATPPSQPRDSRRGISGSELLDILAKERKA